MIADLSTSSVNRIITHIINSFAGMNCALQFATICFDSLGSI